MELWLKALRNDVRKEITIQAFDATLPEIVSTAVTPWHRKVSLEPLDVVIQHAMKTFDSRPDESDRWLAPRVHSALRLFRSEAATQGIWDFLSVVAFPDYVKWRWIKDGKGDIRRVLGPDHRHAIARLWWAAELTRNGDDYKGTVNAFTSQTAVQHILELRAFCSRPATLGFVEFVASSRSGSWASDREIPRYVNALNYALSTTVLDALVPDEGSNIESLNQWIGQEPDALLMLDNLPLGPDEPKVDDNAIETIVSLLTRLKAQALKVEESDSELETVTTV